MRSVDTEAERLHWLAFFALNRDSSPEAIVESLARMPDEDTQALMQLADLHHVLRRIFEPIADIRLSLSDAISSIKSRNAQTVSRAAAICEALEEQGCPAMAIKSTDHWPDLGNDFDLFTTGAVETVHRIMKDRFTAELQPQNWADRLANKWNFRIPGIEPLIEIHVDRLGQTGELKNYGNELIERRQQRSFEGTRIWIPAREDQIVLATLQRLYRHFFYRICDFADCLEALSEGVDFERLRQIAKRHGIWQGVATHLRVTSEYANHYRGTKTGLPPFVSKAARFGIERLYPHAGYLRLPLFPQGATLWGRQVIKTWHQQNRSGAIRLGLLPPLAAAAGASYKITGRQKIW